MDMQGSITSEEVKMSSSMDQTSKIDGFPNFFMQTQERRVNKYWIAGEEGCIRQKQRQIHI